MRPNSYLTTDATIFYDLTTYDVDGQEIDADTTPTVSYRVGTNDTLATAGVTVTKVSATTGLYKVEIDLGDVTSVNGASLRFEESAAINGITYLNRWASFVRDASTGYTPSQIADQVWNEATADHLAAGSTGKALVDAGAAASVVVYPVQSVSPQRTNETTLKAYLNETVSFTVLPLDADGVAVDTTGMTLAIVIEDRTTADVETITDASITKTSTSYTFSTVTSNTTLGQKRWSCRNTANANVITTGSYVVSYAPE